MDHKHSLSGKNSKKNSAMVVISPLIENQVSLRKRGVKASIITLSKLENMYDNREELVYRYVV